MTHFKDNCKANDMIIGNSCGLTCVNCGACKCQFPNTPIEELASIEALEQRKLLAQKDLNDFHKRNIHTCYSYPAHQLKAIEKRIKELT